MSGSLASALLVSLDRTISDEGARQRFALVLREKLASARQAWPEVILPPDRLVAHLAEHLRDAADLESALRELCLEGLCLAAACLEREPGAIGALNRIVDEEAKRLVRLSPSMGVEADEIRQLALERAVIADPPRIGAYSGRGELRAWVRVMVSRIAIDLRRRVGTRRQVGLEEAPPEELVDCSGADNDVQVGAHRAAFEEAFQAALAGLSGKDRTLLREQVLAGLSLEELAERRQVHRATVVRWLARIRERLFAETHRELKTRLHASGSEVDSLLRGIWSQAQVTLERLLRDEDDAAGP